MTLRMRRPIKILIAVVAILLSIPVGLLAYLMVRYPEVAEPSTQRVEATAERIERGSHLVHDVLACFSCHAERDWEKFAAPVKAGTEGGAGLCIRSEHGAPGTICAPNITPHPTAGIGAWTDGEIIRAIREGVSRDGRALFPMMPYQAYRALSDEDVASVVAYLRTLPALETQAEPTEIMFPVSVVLRTGPAPVEGPVAAPAATSGPEFGRYLVKVANCEGCHTDEPEQPFAGGFVFGGPWGRVVSGNITPDETGLKNVSRADFIARFKAYAKLDGDIPADPGTGTIMPWAHFARMSEDELGSIYDFLRTAKPVSKKVVSRPAPEPTEN